MDVLAAGEIRRLGLPGHSFRLKQLLENGEPAF